MQQEHRLVLALALSALVLFVTRMYLYPENQPTGANKTSTANQEANSITDTKEKIYKDESSQKVAEKVESQKPIKITSGQKREVSIRDTLYDIVIESKGGRIKSWKIKEKSGNQYEMILQEAEGALFGPVALLCQNKEIEDKINGEDYEILDENQQTTKNELKTPTTLILRFQDETVRIEKKFTFHEASYLIETKIEGEQNGKELSPLWMRIGPGMGEKDFLLKKETWEQQAICYFSEGKLNTKAYSAIEESIILEGQVPWAGIQNQYFTVLAIAPEKQTLAGGKIHSWKHKKKDKENKETEISVGTIDVPVFAGASQKIYFGPKEDQLLKSIHPTLDQVIDYGWFRILVQPLLLALGWIYSITPNYGFAIILLTFLITLALFPLRYKQILSMKKMQKIQPQVKAIQDRYKKAKSSAEDRQKMNMETMDLYKKHGVNPVGGCLPLLIQFPFLIAVNNMVGNHFNLRGAHFFLWIQNLAAPDPYYITPVVMGLTMFLSMKMTTPPTTGDPMQNKMMAWMMPGMMTFFFLGLSSGLNLYFLFSNIFSIALQKIGERYIPSLRNA